MFISLKGNVYVFNFLDTFYGGIKQFVKLLSVLFAQLVLFISVAKHMDYNICKPRDIPVQFNGIEIYSYKGKI